MLRWRMLRHGAHQVNRPGLSGSSLRPSHQALLQQLAEELALLRPLTDEPGTLLGVHVHLGARDVHVAAEIRLASRLAQLLCPRNQPRKVELRRVVLVAVRHVDRGEDELAEFRLHDARFHVERGVGKTGSPEKAFFRM